MCDIQWGDIFLCDLDVYNNDKIKRAQKHNRPVVIVSNPLCNKFSPAVTLVPITTQSKQNLPTHVNIGTDSGLLKESTALVECIVTLDKTILKERVGKCSEETMNKINKAIQIQTNSITPFDINKVRRYVLIIENLDKRLDKVENEDDLELRNTLLYELKDYCSTYGKDYKTFYNNSNSEKTHYAQAI